MSARILLARPSCFLQLHINELVFQVANRQFHAERPNALWVSDFTYVSTWAGFAPRPRAALLLHTEDSLMTIRFPWAHVVPLIEHAERAPACSPSYNHLADPRYWRKGATANAHGFVDLEDIDTSTIEPYISLVKDQGCYLMSAGKPAWLVSQEPLRHHVVYAHGLGPDADYDALLDACGGDDFAESLLCSELRGCAGRLGRTPKVLCIELVPGDEDDPSSDGELRLWCQ